MRNQTITKASLLSLLGKIVNGNSHEAMQAMTEAERVLSAAPAPMVAEPKVSVSKYGAFYAALKSAGYVLCKVCCAYREEDHEGCGPMYLYQGVAYNAPAVRVDLTGTLDDDEVYAPTVPEPECEEVAA